MPIKSGIGFGEAQVYDTSGLVNTYGKLLSQQAATQAKEQAKFDTDLAEIISKYSTKGLKDGDIKLTADAYKTLKGKVTRYDTKNPTERAKAMAEARNGMQAIQEYSDNALNAYSTLQKIGPDVLENEWKYKPETVTAIKQLYANPYATWSDDFKDLNQAKLERQPDLSSVNKFFEGVNKNLLEQAQSTNQVTGKEINIGGVKHITSTYFAKPEQATEAILKNMDRVPEVKYTLNKAFVEANPDKKDYTPLDVANFATKMYSDTFGDRAFSFYGGKNIKPTAPKNYDADISNYEVINDKTFYTNEVRKNGKILTPGKVAIKFDKFVTTPVGPAFATPQIREAFNISEAKPEPIGSKKGLKITGMGVKNGNLRVTVVDDDEVEYYLKPQDIPLTIRNGDQFKAAKRALGSTKPASNNFDVDSYLKKKGIK